MLMKWDVKGDGKIGLEEAIYALQIVAGMKPNNLPPSAQISTPSEGAAFNEGDPVILAGSGIDAEDGILTDSSLVWRSTRDGEIGTGPTVTRSDLSVGLHTITLTVTDSNRATGIDSVTVTIMPSPVVVSTSPSDESTKISVTSPVTVIFSEPMSPSDITLDTFTVSDGVTSISGSVSCDGTKVTFIPAGSFDYDTTYTVTISRMIADLDGNQLDEDYSWTFSTGSLQTWHLVGDSGFSIGEISGSDLHIENGTIYVAYVDTGNNDKAMVKRFDGTSWDDVGNTDGVSEAGSTWVRIDYDNDELYVAYVDTQTESKYVVVKKFDGSSWQNIGDVAGHAIHFTDVSVFSAIPYVVYADPAHSGKATVKRYTGTAWESVGTEGFSADPVDSVRIVVDNGVPYIAVRSRSDQHIMGMKFDGESWITLGDTGSMYCWHLDLGVDNGLPYVAYDYCSTVKVIRYDGSSWDTMEPVTALAGSGNKFDVSLFVSNKTPYVGYYDFGYGTGSRSIFKRFNGVGWDALGRTPTSDSFGTGFDISVFVYNDIPYVAYEDYYSGKRITVKKYE